MRTRLRNLRSWPRRILIGLALAAAAGLLPGQCAAAAAAATIRTNGFQLMDLSRWEASEGADALSARFSVVPGGVQVLEGVPFQIGPPRAVTGMELAREGEFHPPTLAGLPLGRMVRRVHLLHTTLDGVKDGTPVAQVVFVYADGGEERVRLGYGVHVREWMRTRIGHKEPLADPNSALAWSRGGEDDGGPQLRLFRTALENPRPGEAVATVALESLFSTATPVVLAVTAEDEDSGRPASLPPAAIKSARDLRENPAIAYRDEFRVRVTDGEGGPALTSATALLVITDDAKSFYCGEVNADSNGVCRVPYPPQHALAFTLLVRAPDRVPALLSESLSSQARFTRQFTSGLSPGVRIGGLVKAPGGQPIAGAEVLIHQVEQTGMREYRRTDSAMARTGADGRWSSACMPAGFSNFSFQVSHPDFRPMLYTMPGQGNVAAAATVLPSARTTVLTRELGFERLTEPAVELDLGFRAVPPQAPPVRQRVITSRGRAFQEVSSNALATSTAEFTLPPAIRIQGTLLGQDARPIPDTEVLFQRNNPAFERRRVRTDAQGRFQLATPDPGDGALIVVRDGHTPLHQYLNIEPGLPSLELRLAAARTLRGRVVDRQQRPVPGARVRLDEWQGTADLLRFQTLTDEEGRFAWTGAPPDQVTFQLSKTNCYTTRHSTGAGVPEVTLFLNRLPGISGRVIDADTRQPIDGFKLVRGRKYSQNDPQIHWERYDTPRGRGGEYFIRLEDYYFQPEARLMVEAPGYVPAISPGFTASGTHAHDFALKKGQGLRGVVTLAGGEPAAGATVVLVCRGDSGHMDAPGQLRSGGSQGEFARTDARGRFDFSPKLEMEGILVAHEAGYAEARVPQSATNLALVLQPWARVQGVMKVGDAPEPERWVLVQNHIEPSEETPAGRSSFLGIYLKAEPDAAGRFLLEKVPPGRRRIDVEYRLRERNYGEMPLSHGQVLSLRPGETNDVTLGGTGRQVVGRVKVTGGAVTDVDWRRDTHWLMPVEPAAARPSGLATLVGGLLGAPPPRPASVDPRKYVLLFETNGSFRIDHVPPGKYMLLLNVTDPEEEYYNRRPMGNAQQSVEVPEVAGAKLNEPLDIGAIELAITPKLRLGRPAPDFEAKAFDGKPVKLSDHRGKHVLLFFWASYAGLGSYDLNVLRELHTTYGAQGQLVVLGLNVDASLDAASNFARNQNMTWTQLHLGERGQSKVPAAFGVDGFPMGLLLDGEGKLVARQLRGSNMRSAVRNALE